MQTHKRQMFTEPQQGSNCMDTWSDLGESGSENSPLELLKFSIKTTGLGM